MSGLQGTALYLAGFGSSVFSSYYFLEGICYKGTLLYIFLCLKYVSFSPQRSVLLQKCVIQDKVVLNNLHPQMPCSTPTEKPDEVGIHQWASHLTDEKHCIEKIWAICPGTHSWCSDYFCSVSPALKDNHKRAVQRKSLLCGFCIDHGIPFILKLFYR